VAVNLVGIRYSWQHIYEAFGICRNCTHSTTFILEEEAQHHDIGLFKKTSPLKITDSLNGLHPVPQTPS
jgi:hypothetical protein